MSQPLTRSVKQRLREALVRDARANTVLAAFFANQASSPAPKIYSGPLMPGGIIDPPQLHVLNLLGITERKEVSGIWEPTLGIVLQYFARLPIARDPLTIDYSAKDDISVLEYIVREVLARGLVNNAGMYQGRIEDTDTPGAILTTAIVDAQIDVPREWTDEGGNPIAVEWNLVAHYTTRTNQHGARP